jgi:hypothetical protein
MSQILIQQYLNQLQDLRTVSGTHRESVVREAFKDLLKGCARERVRQGVARCLPNLTMRHLRRPGPL